MSEETTPEPESNESFVAELSGKRIRRISPDRLLKSGDKLINRYGQELWECVAFHPKGVRVTQWPHGNLADWSWENVHKFYERAEPQETK